MKPEYKYYNIEELLQRWSKYKVTEKNISRWGADNELQFSIVLGPSTGVAHIEISQYYDTDSGIERCDTKKVSFEKKELFDVTPLTVSDLLCSPNKKRVIVHILPWCKGCGHYTSSCDDVWTITHYELDPTYDHFDQRTMRDPDDFLLRCTKNDLVVKLDEILRFEKLFNSTTTDSNCQDDGTGTSFLIKVNKFIEKLTIRYESDSQITIQKPGKPKIDVTLESLGFRGIGVTWSNFLDVLKTPPKHYWECPEDSDRKQLKVVSEKLIVWMTNNLQIKFPDKYRLYYRVKTEKPGIYQFKFNIEYSDTIPVDESSKETFRRKFFPVLEKALKDPYNKDLQKKVSEMAADGFLKKFLTKVEVKLFLKPDKQKNNLEKAQIDNFIISEKTTMKMTTES